MTHVVALLPIPLDQHRLGLLAYSTVVAVL
jgi:hypothetical protein